MWLFVSSCVYEIPRLFSLLVYLDERLGVLVFGCVAIDVVADPVRLGVSTPALLYKV